MARLLAPFLALPLLLAAPAAFARQPSVQKTIAPRPAVHYYPAKPLRPTFISSGSRLPGEASA